MLEQKIQGRELIKINREELIEAFTMKIDGSSLEEIAEKFDTTKQNVSQSINRAMSRKPKDFKCIYPELKKYMKSNNISPERLYSIMCGKSVISGGSKYIKSKLNGESKFTLPDIQKLIEITGIPFEILFLIEGS